MVQQAAPQETEQQYESFGKELYAHKYHGVTDEESLRGVFKRWNLPYVPDILTRTDFGTRGAGSMAANKSAADLVPFVGTVKGGLDIHDIWDTSNRLIAGKGEEGDQRKVTDWLIAESQPRTWGAKATDVAMQAPKWGVEWWATGGLLKAIGLVAKGTAGAAGAVTKEAVTEMAKKASKIAIAGRLGAEIAARATLHTTNETYDVAFRKAIPQLGENEAGELAVKFDATTGTFLESLGEGYRRSVYETASEMSGGVMSQQFGKLIPGVIKMHQAAFVAAVMKKTGLGATAALREITHKIGWHGAIEEYGEEVFGGALRALDPGMHEGAADIVPGFREGYEEDGLVGGLKTALHEGSAMIAGFAAFGGAMRGAASMLPKGEVGTVEGQVAPVEGESPLVVPEQSGEIGEQNPKNTDQAQKVATPDDPTSEPIDFAHPEDLERFAGPGATAHEARTPGQRAFVQFAKDRMGTEAVPVMPSDPDAKIKGDGMSSREGQILFDARIDDNALLEFTVGHELRHDIDRVYKALPNLDGGPAKLAADIEEAAGPEIMESVRSGYEERRARSPLGGIPYETGELGEETQADLAGQLMPLLEVMGTSEGFHLTRRVIGRRKTWERIVDGLVNLVQGTKAYDARRAARSLEALLELKEQTGRDYDERAIHAASRIHEAMTLVRDARLNGHRAAAKVRKQQAAEPETQQQETPEEILAANKAEQDAIRDVDREAEEQDIERQRAEQATREAMPPWPFRRKWLGSSKPSKDGVARTAVELVQQKGGIRADASPLSATLWDALKPDGDRSSWPSGFIHAPGSTKGVSAEQVMLDLAEVGFDVDADETTGRPGVNFDTMLDWFEAELSGNPKLIPELEHKRAEYESKRLGGGDASMGYTPEPGDDSEYAPFSPAGPVGSPAFSKWFGDSKVVDAQGKPLMVFHGTAAEFFSEFLPGQSGIDERGVVYFTTSASIAEQYMDWMPEYIDLGRAGRLRGMIDAAADAEKEMDAIDDAFIAEGSDMMIDDFVEAKDALRAKHPELVIAERASEALRYLAKQDELEGGSIYPVYLSIQNPHVDDFRGDAWDPPRQARAIKQAHIEGHDGVHFKNIMDGEPGSPVADNWVIFDPVQAKSVHNRGTWDPTNPDVRYSPAADLPPKGTPADKKKSDKARTAFVHGANRHRKLANPATDPSQRAFSDAMDTEMEKAGEPGIWTIEQNKAAGKIVAEDRAGIRARLLEAGREDKPLEAIDQEAARIIRNEAAEKALSATTDEESSRWHVEAVRLHNAYRRMRGGTGRALSAIRDAVPHWARSAQERLAEIMYTLPPREARKLRSFERKLVNEHKKRDSEAKTREIERLNRQMKKLLDKDLELMKRAAAELRVRGINTGDLTRQDLNDPHLSREIAEVIGKHRFGFWDWFAAFRTNAILTGPGTHVRNIGGNIANTALHLGVRRASEALVASVARKLTGRQLERSASWAEFKVMAPQLHKALPAAFRNAMRAWATGLPGLEAMLREEGRVISEVGSKLEQRERLAIPSWMFAGFDYAGFRALEAGDALIKTVAYLTEYHALAMREAKATVEEGEDLMTRYGVILNDHTHPIVEQAYQASLYTAFQGKPDQFEQQAMVFREWLDDKALGVPIGYMMFPFIGTPWKIFKTAMRVTPLQVLKMVGGKGGAIAKYKGKTSDEAFIREVADTLIAAMVFWTVYSMLGGDDDEPLITGSRKWGGEGEMQWRTAPPMSVKMGDGYVSYAGYEPGALSVGVMVDAVEAWKMASESGDVEAGGAMAAKVFQSIKSQLQDKTFLRTLGDLSSLVDGRKSATDFGRDLVVTPMVPNLIRSPLRSADDYFRQNVSREQEGVSAFRQMMTTLPYTLLPAGIEGHAPPPKRDAWGRKVKRLGDAIIPLDIIGDQLPIAHMTRKDPALPADLALRRWNRAVERGTVEGQAYWPRVSRFSSGSGPNKVIWTPEEHDEHVRLTGEAALKAVSRIDFSFLEDADGLPSVKTIDRIRGAFSKAKSSATRELKKRRRNKTSD